MWFEALTGFAEESPEQVRENLSLADHKITSHANGQTFSCGELEIPSLGELREQVCAGKCQSNSNTVREIVANVQKLHLDESYADSLFQVASQFNLLEMVSPHVTPEDGIGRYENDHTQGPACAIAAGAGTIYRNYFVPVNGHVGQSADNQIDCLAELGAALGNSDERLWKMKNGYVLATEAGLTEIAHQLREANEEQRDNLRRLLRVGIHWKTQVTLDHSAHKVSQIYCSALPVSYNHFPASLWEGFARLILEAACEATLCAAILNTQRNGSNKVFLTMLGGGAFGNRSNWIVDAMQRALSTYNEFGLDVMIVSFGSSQPAVQGVLT